MPTALQVGRPACRHTHVDTHIVLTGRFSGSIGTQTPVSPPAHPHLPPHRESGYTVPLTGPHLPLPPPLQPLLRTLPVMAARGLTPALVHPRDGRLREKEEKEQDRAEDEPASPLGVSLLIPGLIPSWLSSHLRGHLGNQMKRQARGRAFRAATAEVCFCRPAGGEPGRPAVRSLGLTPPLPWPPLTRRLQCG